MIIKMIIQVVQGARIGMRFAQEHKMIKMIKMIRGEPGLIILTGGRVAARDEATEGMRKWVKLVYIAGGLLCYQTV